MKFKEFQQKSIVFDKSGYSDNVYVIIDHTTNKTIVCFQLPNTLKIESITGYHQLFSTATSGGKEFNTLYVNNLKVYFVKSSSTVVAVVRNLELLCLIYIPEDNDWKVTYTMDGVQVTNYAMNPGEVNDYMTLLVDNKKYIIELDPLLDKIECVRGNYNVASHF